MQVQLAFWLVGLSAVSGSQTSGSAGFGPPENVRIALASEGALSFSWSTAVEVSFLVWSSLVATPKPILIAADAYNPFGWQGLGGLGNYTPECRASTTKGGQV